MNTTSLSFRFLKYFLLWMLIMLPVSGCTMFEKSNAPPDFVFMMDVRTAEKGSPQNVNIQIHENGKGKYDYYDTGGVIQYDVNDIVTYTKDQVVKEGTFKLSKSELNQLWDAINTNNIFALDDDYRMEIGSSYAFILIWADGKQHIVDNIGMEVPEVRALVEIVQGILPEGVEIDYGEGTIPLK